jgi:hypothetical protein
MAPARRRTRHLGIRGLIQKNRVCQKQNPAKSKSWIPAFAGMTIFSAYL